MSVNVVPNSPSTISASATSYLATLVSHTEEAIVLFNMNWDIQQISLPMLRMLHAKEIKDVNQLTYKLGYDCIEAYKSMACHNETACNEVVLNSICVIDEIEKNLTFKIACVYEEGEPLGRILRVLDNSDEGSMKSEITYLQTQLEEQTRQLARYKDSNLQLENFAYIASHDLREPVRTINNFTQLLSRKMGEKLDTEEQEYFAFIKDGVGNMDMLINDLLMYSRVNSGEHSPEEFKMENVMLVILNGLNQSIKEKEAEIQCDNLPETILGNKTKIKQLFQNLIANAIKFRKPDIPPKVIISAGEDATHWKFSIADNGIGIKEEYFDKIFMIFKKLHSKHEFQGSGIGLAICKKIVEQHDGEIWVESVPDQGTTFFFTIAKSQGKQ